MKVTLNPDPKVVEQVRAALKQNDNYCPCSVLHNADTKCMCKAFRNRIDKGEPGECHCGLYILKSE